jgi:hypothetical protein
MRGDVRHRLKALVLVRSIENARMEEAQRNRYANFLLRGVLGMLARVRHAVCPRRAARQPARGRADMPKGLRTDLRQ